MPTGSAKSRAIPRLAGRPGSAGPAPGGSAAAAGPAPRPAPADPPPAGAARGAGPTERPGPACGGPAAGPAGPGGTRPAVPTLRQVVGVEPLPAHAGARKRLLHDVLGVLEVAGDREQLHDQTLVVRLVERGEVAVARHRLPPGPHVDRSHTQPTSAGAHRRSPDTDSLLQRSSTRPPSRPGCSPPRPTAPSLKVLPAGTPTRRTPDPPTCAASKSSGRLRCPEGSVSVGRNPRAWHPPARKTRGAFGTRALSSRGSILTPGSLGQIVVVLPVDTGGMCSPDAQRRSPLRMYRWRAVTPRTQPVRTWHQ